MPYQAFRLHEFATRFATTESCLSAIIARRWPTGWKCLHCGGDRHHRLRTRRVLQCAAPACRRQCSITAGTLFEQTKLALPKVFLAIYLMTDKQGISAMALSKHLGCHYDSAYRLLRLLRRAMATHDQRYLLDGVIQVDEAYVGGHGDGRHRRGRARDTKRLLAVAVEQIGPDVSGFIHLDVLPAADAESLHGMILEKVRRGSRLLTDGWKGYHGIDRKGFVHEPRISPGKQAASLQWPLVHRAISNFTRWLLGTHRNCCQRYLPDYAAEFCWRTNRRNRSQDDFRLNQREALLPDRLLTLAAQQKRTNLPPHHAA
jgi:transposase-like protein